MFHNFFFLVIIGISVKCTTCNSVYYQAFNLIREEALLQWGIDRLIRTFRESDWGDESEHSWNTVYAGTNSIFTLR
jgi:hypothetical protein